MAQKISDLPSAGSLSGANLLAIVQSGATNKITWTALLAEILAASEAVEVDSGNYTATPAGTHTITMSDTTGMEVGLPIRAVQSAVTRHQIITAVTTNTSITTSGAPLNTGDTISQLLLGRASETIQIDLPAPGTYAAGGTTNTLLLETTKQKALWLFHKAYLVNAHLRHNTPDGGANEPKVNIRVNGADVFSENSGDGAQMPAGTSFVELVNADISNYEINREDEIELSLTNAGTNGTAMDLTVHAVFVLG